MESVSDILTLEILTMINIINARCECEKCTVLPTLLVNCESAVGASIYLIGFADIRDTTGKGLSDTQVGQAQTDHCRLPWTYDNNGSTVIWLQHIMPGLTTYCIRSTTSERSCRAAVLLLKHLTEKQVQWQSVRTMSGKVDLPPLKLTAENLEIDRIFPERRQQKTVPPDEPQSFFLPLVDTTLNSLNYRFAKL